MAFRIRTVQEIVDGMLSTVGANSDLTDVNRGSATRSVLEAGALQDAAQYIQIARLKKTYSIDDAIGADLDERIAEYKDIVRRQPSQSRGSVQFGDTRFPGDRVAGTLDSAGGPVGASSVIILGAASFPTVGSLVFGQGLASQEKVPYTAKSSLGGGAYQFSLGSNLTYAHSAGSEVLLSTFGANKVWPSGTIVSVPATVTTAQIDFTTQAAVSILDGDTRSSAVSVISKLTGAATNVGSGQISKITNPLDPTSTVANAAAVLGGADQEKDEDLRQRVKAYIRALSNATENDVLTAAQEVQLPSGQRVMHAQLVERILGDTDATLYIDDGSGLLSAEPLGYVSQPEPLIFPAETGQLRARLSHWPIVPSSLSLRRSVQRGTITSVSTASNPATVVLSTTGLVIDAYVNNFLVDSNRNVFLITGNASGSVTVNSVNYFTGAAVRPVPGAFAIIGTSSLLSGVDYVVNESNGDLELKTGLLAGDALIAWPVSPTVAAYAYYQGLIAEVQKVINGDPLDRANYPGVKAAGVKIVVAAPSTMYISFSITILSALGTGEADLETAVQSAVQTYVNGLGSGEDVILAEVVAAVMSVPKVTDCTIGSPLTNVVVADGVLPRTKFSLISVY